MRVRMVDVTSDRYKIARSYMLRLKTENLQDKVELAALARVANMTPAAFKKRFGYLVENDGQPSIAPRNTSEAP
jgi:6-phosphofructokinase 1